MTPPNPGTAFRVPAYGFGHWHPQCTATCVPSTLRYLTVFCVAVSAWGQDASRAVPLPDPTANSPAPKKKHERKHIFWVIPDYRTTPIPQDYKPLKTADKFGMAWDGATDPGTFLLAGAFAGKDQLFNNNPTFGQGTKGYAHRFITNYADLTIGDFMTEGVFPTMLRQDPRYFRRGSGNAWSRLGNAVGQLFWTRTDSGGHTFNFSEVGGNAAATAISTAYYPEGRHAADSAERWGIQIGLDMASNIMKEFWPDLHHKLAGRKSIVNP
jgi:hypothetical protein